MKLGKRLTHLSLYLSFSLAGAALSFGAVLVLTRFLQPAEYGVIGIFFSILYIVTPLVSMAADGLVSVNKSRLDVRGYIEFQRTYIAVALLAFLALQGIFLAGRLTDAYSLDLLVFVPAFALVRFLAAMAAAESVIEEKPLLYGLVTVSSPALALILTVAFLNFFGNWAGWRILAMFLAEIVVVLFRYKHKLTVLVHPVLDRKIMRQILAFGLPSLLAVAGGWALNESDKIIVARELGLANAGIYTAAASLAAIMMTLNQSVTNALYPAVFNSLKAGDRIFKVLLRNVCSFVAISGTLCVCVMLLYFIVADKLLPPRYHESTPVFLALVASSLAVSFYRPFGLVADYFRIARSRAIAILLGGGTALLAITLSVRHGGIIWAPAGMAAGYLVAAAVLALALSKMDPRHHEI